MALLGLELDRRARVVSDWHLAVRQHLVAGAVIIGVGTRSQLLPVSELRERPLIRTDDHDLFA